MIDGKNQSGTLLQSDEYSIVLASLERELRNFSFPEQLNLDHGTTLNC